MLRKFIMRGHNSNLIMTPFVRCVPLKCFITKEFYTLSIFLNKKEINSDLLFNLNKMESDIKLVDKKVTSSLRKIKVVTNSEEKSEMPKNMEYAGTNESSNNKKNKLKIEKKLSKKLAKAIQILLFHEGGVNNKEIKSHTQKREIFSEVPKENLWVYHFGDGDEDDQLRIKEYMENTYGECKVFIFPGISYGFIQFNNISDAIKLAPVAGESKNPHKSINLSSPHKIQFSNGERTIFTFFSKIPFEEVDQNYNSNFPIASYFKENLIPGLYVIDNFITEDEERDLIENIDKKEWVKLSNRRVQHYGYEFIYGANKINKNNKIGEFPDFCDFLMKKLEPALKKFVKKTQPSDHFEAVNFKFENTKELSDAELVQENLASFKNLYNALDQLTINEYSPGEGIPPHIDSHSPFEDVFCSLSLGSGTVMTLTSPNDESHHIYLKPRSIIFFSGESRFTHSHSIALRKLDKVEDKLIFRKRRISLTFRKIRNGECSCPYVKHCDSQKVEPAPVSLIEEFKIKLEDNKNSDVPTEIEKKHVYDVYEKIAPHFSHTRYKPWPKVAEYLHKLPKGAFNADVGCGNGKYLNVNNEVFSFGTDRSFNLVNICKEKNSENQLFVADSLKLPFRSNILDSVISIAVVHHFSNVELRLKAISELIRILRPSGTLLIYVWALEQDNKKFEHQDNFVPWHLQNTFENNVKVESLGPENLKEDKKNSTVYHRYYHMFKKGELEDLLKKFENISIVESYYDHENWCCILKKEY